MNWREAFNRALISGSTASVLSAAALAVCGKIENGAAAGPQNGPSQWVWGERAAYRRDASLRYTGVGYGIHHLSSVFWATFHEKHVARLVRDKPFATRLAAAGCTALVANFVDFQLTPRRLKPGFEKQLNRKSLFVVYAAFALGLALGQRR
jgi:hypothetical protein